MAGGQAFFSSPMTAMEPFQYMDHHQRRKDISLQDKLLRRAKYLLATRVECSRSGKLAEGRALQDMAHHLANALKQPKYATISDLNCTLISLLKEEALKNGKRVSIVEVLDSPDKIVDAALSVVRHLTFVQNDFFPGHELGQNLMIFQECILTLIDHLVNRNEVYINTHTVIDRQVELAVTVDNFRKSLLHKGLLSGLCCSSDSIAHLLPPVVAARRSGKRNREFSDLEHSNKRKR